VLFAAICRVFLEQREWEGKIVRRETRVFQW
jgi:hypothetical protein